LTEAEDNGRRSRCGINAPFIIAWCDRGMEKLGRLLLSGYGLAAVAAAAAAMAGAGLAAVALLFWIGGAAAVAGLAMRAAARMPPEAIATDAADAEEAVLAEALAAWERDRLADRAPARAGTTDRVAG
jgi:hypothetical protein